MSKASPLEQALRDAWYDGYKAAMDQIAEDSGTPAEYDFEKYMERTIESLEKGEEQ